MRRSLQLVLVFLFIQLLIACSPVGGLNNQNVDMIQQSLDEKNKTSTNLSLQKDFEVDQDTLDVLMPDVTAAEKKEEHFDVSVRDMPAKDFFYSLMQSTPYSIAVSPEVKGNISLQLKNVTVTQTLAAVHNLYAYKIEKNTYGYTIYPAQLETRLFVLHRLNMGRAGSSESSITNPGLGRSQAAAAVSAHAVSLKSTFDNTHYWEQVNASIESIISQTPGASVQVNQNTGVVLVRATEDDLAQVAQYIQMTTDISSRQVLIEAKIMEVTLTKQYSTGINWNQLGLHFDSATGIVTIDPPMSDKLEGFESVIQLLTTQGQVTVLSSPRVATINNQQALIKVGDDRYYVTDVTADTTPIGNSTQSTSDVTLEPFFSGIALEVLPNIEKSGMVTLFIHPVISNTQDDVRRIEISETQTMVLPMAKSDIRESDSVVKVQDNQIIILGGLMESAGLTSHSTFPFLQNSGMELGATDKGQITELVIMLKATVIGSNEQWNQVINDSQDNLSSVMKQYSKGMS